MAIRPLIPVTKHHRGGIGSRSVRGGISLYCEIKCKATALLVQIVLGRDVLVFDFGRTRVHASTGRSIEDRREDPGSTIP
eukprot:1160418-Rhodomonas_salina.1